MNQIISLDNANVKGQMCVKMFVFLLAYVCIYVIVYTCVYVCVCVCVRERECITCLYTSTYVFLWPHGQSYTQGQALRESLSRGGPLAWQVTTTQTIISLPPFCGNQTADISISALGSSPPAPVPLCSIHPWCYGGWASATCKQLRAARAKMEAGDEMVIRLPGHSNSPGHGFGETVVLRPKEVHHFFFVPFREQPIYSTRAHVFQIDPSTKKNWVPTSKHAVTVSYFYDSTRNVYRIISLDGTKVRVKPSVLVMILKLPCSFEEGS